MEIIKRWIAAFLALLALFPVLCPARADTAVRFERHGIRDENRNVLITYWVYAPPALPPHAPLVVYLHGSGEQGERALMASLPLFVKEGIVLCEDAVLLVPQLPSQINQWLSVENALGKMIGQTIEAYGLDENRIALVGFSLGGIGAYDLANLFRGRFRKVIAVSGRGNEDVSPAAFADCETRTFVGTRDTNMPPKSALDFASRLEEEGYASETVQFDSTHSRMPYHVFQDQKALGAIWMELAAPPTPSPEPLITDTPAPVLPAKATASDGVTYRTLKLGMNGSDVHKFKKAMYWLGYFNSLNVSDEYNSLTVERVKKLQKNNGLEETGIADAELQALVFSGSAVKTDTAPKPSSTPKPK